MKLAAIQYQPPKGQPDKARADLVALVAQAVDDGAQLVVLPELATTGYVWPSKAAIRPFCEPADGPTLAALAPLAARGAWIVCGYAEQGDDDRLYNAALVIGPDGLLVASYRKVLLYELDETWATGGRRRMILPTALGSLAPAICMDINDPRLQWWLRTRQPDLLAFPTNWVEEGDDVHAYWRDRLAGFGGMLVAANRWGVDEGVPFSGRSAILGPGGQVLAQLGATGDGILSWDSASPS